MNLKVGPRPQLDGLCDTSSTKNTVKVSYKSPGPPNFRVGLKTLDYTKLGDSEDSKKKGLVLV